MIIQTINPRQTSEMKEIGKIEGIVFDVLCQSKQRKDKNPKPKLYPFLIGLI